MSWQDRYQQASFRGVRFLTDSTSTEFGRRVVVHEFPFAEDAESEDLGKKTRRYTLNAYVIGDDHDLQRQQLIAAFEQPGTGELVHPDYGRLTVRCEPGTVENNGNGRITRFSLKFVEVKSQPATSLKRNVQADRNVAFEALALAAMKHFPQNLKVGG